MTSPTPTSPAPVASATVALIAAVAFVATAAALSFLPDRSSPDAWQIRGALDASRPLQDAGKPV